MTTAASHRNTAHKHGAPLLDVSVIIVAAHHSLGALARAITSAHDARHVVVVCADADAAECRDAGADVTVTRPAGGVASARNAGLRHADSEFVLFLDPEDLLCTGGLALLHTALHTHPASVAAGGQVLFRGTPRSWPPRVEAEIASRMPRVGLALLLSRNVLPIVNGALLRRESLGTVPLFRELFEGEWHATIRVRTLGPYTYVHAPVVQHTIDPDGEATVALPRLVLRASRHALVEPITSTRGRNIEVWRWVNRLAGIRRRFRDRDMLLLDEGYYPKVT